MTFFTAVAGCRCSADPAEAPTENRTSSEGGADVRGDPALPGIEAPDSELGQTLAMALAAKGEGYTPRTEHVGEEGEPRFTNRLITEKSPYLLQHAHNPVNWFPWSEEAFERARRDNKPVLLSVGYSTCHWCHVMEHESFEDLEIAAAINRGFIPIKVDREERPDIDDIYMTAVQLLTGRGGWPMTVALTSEGEPFFGGTYFPPRDGVRGARRGFLSILHELARRFREDRTAVVAEAQQLSQRIEAATAPQPPGDVPTANVIAEACERLMVGFDHRFGGWGRAPKFPQPSRIGLLLRHARHGGGERALSQVRATLDAMAAGGIYDQVGGGFHRYATDAQWLVPHFEKMLYDNAQLTVSYVEGWQATGDEDYQRVARETLDYVLREMRSPSGAFYSATDADSVTPSGEREEGYFFTWTPAELGAVLSDDERELVTEIFSVTPGGNFEGRSILHRPSPLAAVARTRDVSRSAMREALDSAMAKLYEERATRPAPLRDDKVLTAWNALMISAFSRAGWAFAHPPYIEAASRAAHDIWVSARDGSGHLQRRVIEGEARHRAVLADHAFLIRALLDLHEATGELSWLEKARQLQTEQDRDYSADGGAYWMTAKDAEQLLVRQMPSHDGALPSGNAIAADNLLRLSSLLDDNAFKEKAERSFAAMSLLLRQQGLAMPRMLQALARYYAIDRQVVIVYRDDPASAEPLLSRLRSLFLPNRVVVVVPETDVERQAGVIPLLKGKAVLGDAAATAYVCEHGHCELPTSSPEVFSRQLAAGPR